MLGTLGRRERYVRIDEKPVPLELPKVVAEPKVCQPLFRLRHVTKTFITGGQTVRALLDVSLEIPSGQIVGLSGENGSGKTTLLHVLGGLYLPDTGSEVFYRDPQKGLQAIHYNDPKFLANYRCQISWMFQRIQLISHLVVWQNIALPLELRGVSSAQARKIALGLLADFGLSEIANQRAAEPSGGQRQIAAMLRAVAVGSQVILADEPTARLDRGNTAKVMELMKRINQDTGISIVLVSHDPFVEKFCQTRFVCQKTSKGNIIKREVN